MAMFQAQIEKIEKMCFERKLLWLIGLSQSDLRAKEFYACFEGAKRTISAFRYKKS